MSRGDENFLSCWVGSGSGHPLHDTCANFCCASSCSLVGVLAHLFGSTGAGDDIHLDCTLMLWLESICWPDTGGAQP